MWISRRLRWVGSASQLGAAHFGTRCCSTTTYNNKTGNSECPTQEHVWNLWNEGDLFSLNVAQLDAFLTKNKVTPNPARKKALLVRQVEEVLQAQDAAAKGISPPAPSSAAVAESGSFSRGGGGGRRGGGPSRGDWAGAHHPVSQPETLLDLAQSGFYDSPQAMVPRAFQLLTADSAPEVVVSRINTASFPSFPANSECYTLAAADAPLAMRTRFSKAFQWCVWNLSNLQLHGECAIDFGKLIVKENIMKKNRRIVSAFSLQQRLQVQQGESASDWLSAVSADSIPAMEALLADEMFVPSGRSYVEYDVKIQRASDVLELVVNAKGQTVNVNRPWQPVQSTFVSNANGIDTRLQLRTRPIIRKDEHDFVAKLDVIKLDKEEISAVLAPEHGQVVYASENEVRRWEKKSTMSGLKFTVVETRRQPLIVLQETEEDPRVEYQLVASLARSGPQEAKHDLRLLSLELYDTAKVFADTLSEGFVKQFQCTPQAVVGGALP